ncbi:uncharacterized protein LOC136029525 [Artemia franciscana]|uniref:Inositol-3-phosphate synthase n=1 Tax=Artemia franciscana TaxID=6661 RepID=A0AA88KZW1_ARTSF|nr:hypothetical protein QYM36_015381 [Artemia franciscana]KAK2707666.1 hypothetical protein QYM36_015381 [Artemia franciscana]
MPGTQFIQVKSPNVIYGSTAIESTYDYTECNVQYENDRITAVPETTTYNIRTQTLIPKLGVMLVGWGGNNGSTLTAAVLANKLGLSWPTKEGTVSANFYGSIIQSSTILLGTDESHKEVFVPLRSMVPFVNPEDIVFDGWDISHLNLREAMRRAQVLDYHLQEQLADEMVKLRPRPSIYDSTFIAANQAERANNIIAGTREQQMDQIRKDIRDFKKKNSLEKVIVLWTANTERFSEVRYGLNDTAENLLSSIKKNESEVSPSTIFAVASILEGCAYINGSPQNTFVPGCIELAEKYNVPIGGDDFKSGQTKLKSVLVDFLIQAGIKPVSIVSYNHLGNNDGLNLSAPSQFKSKEISKTAVIDDMLDSNSILYRKDERPDHCVVIKYVPYVGDSKRAMDEYTSEIMMGGKQTFVIHNTCEDSLLAAPIILDLILLCEFLQRISFKEQGSNSYVGFHPVYSYLSYLLKAPLTRPGFPAVNSLFRQRYGIENLIRACVGLPPNHQIMLKERIRKMVSTEDLNGKTTENGVH